MNLWIHEYFMDVKIHLFFVSVSISIFCIYWCQSSNAEHYILRQSASNPYFLWNAVGFTSDMCSSAYCMFTLGLNRDLYSLFSAAACRPCWIPQQTPTMSASCLAASVHSGSSMSVEHITWPPTPFDTWDSPNILSRGTGLPDNSPTMPLQGVPGSHSHCFGEAEILLWHSRLPAEPQECQNCSTYLSTYSSFQFKSSKWNWFWCHSQLLLSVLT